MFSNQQHYLQPPGLLCKLLQKWARKVVSVFAVTQRQCEFLAAAWAPEGSAPARWCEQAAARCSVIC